MSYLRLAASIVLIGAALGDPVHATTFFQQSFTCPVGGKTFKSRVMGSNSTFGQRPDGRPYSPMPVPPLVECPDNGFILYQETFSKPEVAKATALVASDAYRRVRAEETQYYRLWWLRREMGGDAYTLAQDLMVAAWETDADPGRKARYQAAFVEAVAALDPKAAPEDWFWLTLRAANAQRELGRFEDASKLLGLLPQRVSALAEGEDREAALRIIKDLAALVDAHMTGPEPLTLVPQHVAVLRCVMARDALVVVERQVCEKAEVREAIARTRAITEDDRELKGEEAVRYRATQDES